MKRVAGSRRPDRGPDVTDGAVLVIALVPLPEEAGFEVRIHNDGVPQEDVVEHLELAISEMKRKTDRSAGMW